MMELVRWGILAVVLVGIGCFSPTPQPGAPCPDGVCPSGLVCAPVTQTCERTVPVDADSAHYDAPTDDAALGQHDAAPDSPPSATGPLLIQTNGAQATTTNSLSV